MSKIALCFLTYENLSRPKLWSQYINKYKTYLNVYIHNKIDFIDNKYGLHKYCVNKKKRVATQYAHKSLVEATLTLFKEAFKNRDNKFFILLSDTCVPLYSFNYIYEKINSLNSNIIHEINYVEQPRFDKVTDKSFFSEKKFLKNSQWITLNRDTVKFFLTHLFLHLFSDNCYAVDEHYFGNICNKYNIKFVNQPITYVNWDDKSDDTNDKPLPKTYNILTNAMVNEIKRNTPSFFMRKISDTCVLPSCFNNL